MDARSNIGHFTQRQLFLTPLPTHVSYNDQPSMDTDTDGELDTLRLLVRRVLQVSHRIQDTQPSTYCSLGVIFMGLGIAKVHQEPIP